MDNQNNSRLQLKVEENPEAWEIARLFIRFHVGSGKNIHLWHNRWHPNTALFLKYGHRIMYDAASSSNALLSSVLQEGNWI